MNKNEPAILVVDDAADTLEVLQRNLQMAGYVVYPASGVMEAVEFLDKTSVDLVITDLKMPRISGLDLVRYIRENLKDTEVMMITGYATFEGAVEAVKAGAEEYLPKPFTDDELLGAVKRSLEKLHMRRLARSNPEDIALAVPGIIGRSPALQEVFQALSKAATTFATILITGESGTGKELVGRAIHYLGPRSGAPFVPINCGAIPGELVESELFGNMKGAFTGATTSRAGFFQTADGGTIFLDEVGEMSPSTQVKVLRVVEDKEVYMVGATKPIRVDTRIIAATNKNLLSLVKQGTFREDLYFRLSVITIHVPPLRDREDDVLLLTTHFASKFSREAGMPTPEFSSRVLEVFREYAWPGNIRELENLIQNLMVMKEGPVIDVFDLPAHMRFSVNRSAGLHRTLAEVELDYIHRVLQSVKGNKTQAATILGIDRKTLREKLKGSELASD